MLVVTRKRNQSIMIGDDIEIIITKIKGRQVRVGIIADRDKYPVHRRENPDEVNNFDASVDDELRPH